MAVDIHKTKAIKIELDCGVSISVFTIPKLKKLQRTFTPDGIYVGCAGEGETGQTSPLSRIWSQRAE
ncbi:hypothetical protein N9048_01055 [bacterium]|nr:hypothetical protein [bacterium]